MVDNINKFDCDKVIVEANIVGKQSEIEFFIPGARLAFINMRQAFSKAPI